MAPRGRLLAHDRLVGTLGALLLIVALLGVLRIELAHRGPAYDVAFPLTASQVGSGDGTLAERAATDVTVALARANVTRVEWTLTWTDDVGEPDEFALAVTSPAGETRRADGTSGRVVVAFDDIAVAPPPLRLTGSEDAAHARVDALASTAAQGTWRASVTLTRAGDQVAPAGGIVLVDDPGNAWSLVARAWSYEARITRDG